MCADCFTNLIYKFDSQPEFEEFDTVIQNKCITNNLTKIKREETNSLVSFDSYELYKCNTCSQIWMLSVPDYAWRGFFLTQDVGLEYLKKLRRDENSRSVGCVVLVVVLLILLVVYFIF